MQDEIAIQGHGRVYIVPLEDILEKSDKHLFQINPLVSHPGQLMFDASAESLLGVEGFKTAHAAQLILNPIAPAGLGSLPHHDVVMKRPYHTSGTGNTTGDKSKIQINRYILRQELEKLFREANVLYWARSLRWVSSTALMVRMLVVSAKYPRECSPVIAVVVADAFLCIAGTSQDFEML